MAVEKVVNIKVTDNVDNTTKNVTSLRTELRKAQQEVAVLSDKFGATSKEATDAAKRAAELKDQIGDARALTDAFNPDAKFKALSASLAGVAGGFGAITGGMNLLGVESKDTEEALLKVQSAMALSQGLQAIGESVDSFKQLGAVIQSTTVFQKANNIATAGAAVVQRLFTGAVNTTSTAFNVLKGAIISTGIGALVVALGYVINKMNESTESTKNEDEALKDLTKSQEAYNKTLNDSLSFLDYEAKLRLERAKKLGKSETDLRNIERGFEEEKAKAYEDEIKRIENRLNTEKLSNAVYSKLLEDRNKLGDEALKFAQQRDINQANFDTQQAEKARDKRKKEIEDQKQHLEELAKQRAEDAVQRGRVAEAQYDKEQKDRLDALDAELNAIIDFDQRVQDNEQNKLKAKADLDLKTASDTSLATDERLKAIQEREDLEKDIIFKSQEEKTAYEKANSDARTEIAKAEAEAKQQMLQKGSQALGQAAQLAGEHTALGKTLAVAATTIDTYQSAVSSYKGMVSAIPGPVGIAAGVVAAAASVAMGLANVKKILSVKIPKAGGGGGAGTPTMASAPPNFNIVGQNSNNQLAQSIANKQQQPLQAYVVSGNITSAQSLDRNKIETATFN